MDGDSSENLLEKILDLRNNKFVIINIEEALYIEDKINHERIGMYTIVTLLLLEVAALIFALFYIGYTNILVSMICFLSATLMMYVKERKTLEDLCIIKSSLEEKELQDVDYIIVGRSQRDIGRAKSILKKAKMGEIESHESLITCSSKILLIDIAIDILILVGIIVLMMSYMYISIYTFLILGASFLYVLLCLTGRILDAISILSKSKES